MFKPYQADTLEALAPQLGLDPGTFVNTVTEYNRAAAGNTELRMEQLDGNSHARPHAAEEQLGDSDRSSSVLRAAAAAGDHVHVHGSRRWTNARASSIKADGAFQNVFAAGEIMSGNILTKGYLGGFGLTIGSVFGRLAGREAAANARA